jgi:hypothetical protein
LDRSLDRLNDAFGAEGRTRDMLSVDENRPRHSPALDIGALTSLEDAYIHRDLPSAGGLADFPQCASRHRTLGAMEVVDLDPAGDRLRIESHRQELRRPDPREGLGH